MKQITETRVWQKLKIVGYKVRQMSVQDWFWLIILISTPLPITGFLVITAQTLGDGFFSKWILLGVIYSSLAVWSEVYYADYIVATSWWKKNVMAWWYRLTKSNSRRQPKDNIPEIIRHLEYFGLFLATASFFFGKPGVIVYANNKDTLPYGYWYLFLGWCTRIVYGYYGLKFITLTAGWTLNMFD